MLFVKKINLGIPGPVPIKKFFRKFMQGSFLSILKEMFKIFSQFLTN